MMDFINKHFTALLATGSILALLALLIVVELFRDFKADAKANGDKTPTVTAVRLTLSTIKNFLMLRKAVKGEESPSRPRSSNPELSGTISVPRDEIR
jgi:hypothetical protein